MKHDPAYRLPWRVEILYEDGWTRRNFRGALFRRNVEHERHVRAIIRQRYDREVEVTFNEERDLAEEARVIRALAPKDA
jgi:hypothetical protein